MKWLVFVCVALCLRHGEGGALKCIPGSEDRSCSSDLEEKEPPIQTSIDDSADDKSLVFECRPGSEWESNCHSCKCTDTGRARCRKMDVCESVILGQRKEETENVAHAEPLIPLYDRELEQQVDLIDNFIIGEHTVFKRSLCRPNEQFNAECNVCRCSPTGGSYKCTQNECMEGGNTKEVDVFSVGLGVDHVEKQTLCRPLAMFQISCNTCRCNYDGTDYSCTEDPCPIPRDVELIRELKDQNNMPIVVSIRNGKGHGLKRSQ